MSSIELPVELLHAAREFFEDRGSHGLEGTAMIAGPNHPRLVIPDQHAARSRLGVSVELTAQGLYDLVTALRDGEHYVARIHSHPGEAFHSLTDDNNPVITFAGGLSIVVPYFGLGLRQGLESCAVYRYSSDGRWEALPPGRSRDQWLVAAPRSLEASNHPAPRSALNRPGGLHG